MILKTIMALFVALSASGTMLAGPHQRWTNNHTAPVGVSAHYKHRNGHLTHEHHHLQPGVSVQPTHRPHEHHHATTYHFHHPAGHPHEHTVNGVVHHDQNQIKATGAGAEIKLAALAPSTADAVAPIVAAAPAATPAAK